MPYIADKKLRTALVNGNLSPINAGELNYLITTTVHRYLLAHGLSYANINLVIGVLECAKAELLRVVVSKYEAKKRLENGAVSVLDSVNLEEVR